MHFCRWPDVFRNTKPADAWRDQTLAKLGVAKWYEHCEFQKKKPTLPFQPRDKGGLGLTHHFSLHDVLHCFDLGITQHILGNLIFHLVFTDVMGVGTPQKKLDIVACLINDEYTKRKTVSQFSTLDIAMFCDPEQPRGHFPYLKGKAGNTRHLAPIVRDIWLSKARKEVPYEQHIGRVLTNVCTIYEKISAKDAAGKRYFVYPPDVHDDIVKAIDNMPLHYSFLCKTCSDVSPPRMLWNMPPTFHHGWHLGGSTSVDICAIAVNVRE